MPTTPLQFASYRAFTDEPPKRAAVSRGAGAKLSFVEAQGVDFYAELTIEQDIVNPYRKGEILHVLHPLSADYITATITCNAGTTAVDVTVEDVPGKPNFVSLFVDADDMSRLCGDYVITLHGLHKGGRQIGNLFEISRGTFTVLPAGAR